MQENTNHDYATHTRLVVRVLQDVVRAERFGTYADLAEALKIRCAALRIFYDAAVVTAAIDRLEEGGRTPLVPPRVKRRTIDTLEPQPSRPLSQVERDVIAVFEQSINTFPQRPDHDAHEARVLRQREVFRRVRPKGWLKKRLEEIFP